MKVLANDGISNSGVEKLLNNGDRWENVLAANIRADNPYR